MSTALQNATINAPATFSFKDAKLNAYSAEIAKIGADMAQRNVELAKIFGKIKAEKCYEADGFKSVAEYAEMTFGVKRAMAYQLANVGERFYNQTTATAKTVTAMLTPANLAEISGMTDGQINHALKSGKISEKSTQKELRNLAKSIKDGSNVGVSKVERQYDGTIERCGSGVKVTAFSGWDMPKIMEGFGEGAIEKTFVTLTKEVEGVKIILAADGTVFKVTYHTHAKETKKAKKATGGRFTIEELKAMLEQAIKAEMEDETEAGE